MSEMQTTPTFDEIVEGQFDEEKEPEPPPSNGHVNHPTNPAISWCGATKPRPGYKNGRPATPPSGTIRCPHCSELRELLGSRWWWETHTRWYESRCHTHDGHAFHSCRDAIPE